MVKIKKELEMSLGELIAWARENHINLESYKSNFGATVDFNEFGDIIFTNDYIDKNDSFTVEVEEEITEETVLPVIVEIVERDVSEEAFIDYQKTIKSILDENINAQLTTRYIYLQNDDGTMTLVWKNGKLVN